MSGEARETAREVTEQDGLCYVDLSRTDFAPGAATLLPEETARRERAVPIERRGGVTVVAVANPADELTLEALRSATGSDVVAVIAPGGQVAAAIAELYGDGPGRRIRRRDAAADDGPEARESAPPRQETRFATSEGLLAGAVQSAPPPPPPPPFAPHPATSTPAAAPAQSHPVPPPAAPVPPVRTVPPVPGTPSSLEESLRAALAPPVADAGAVGAPDRTSSGGGADNGAGSPGTSPPPPPPGKGSPGGGAADVIGDADWPSLARALVRSGRVSVADMTRALRDHHALGEPLARFLQREHLASEEDLVRAMAEDVGLEYVDLGSVVIDRGVAALVPDSVARRHMVVPIRVDDGVLVIAMSNPTDVFAMDDLRSITGRNFKAVVATRSQIDMHLRRLQQTGSGVQEAAKSAAGTVASDAGGYELESLQTVVEDAPIVRYVNLLILQALNERASDIHIEPTPKHLRIRFRIDGVMHDASTASPQIHAAVISRLKVLGEMDITEHRVPQEGRVSVSVGDRQIDLRLAVLPSLHGETCVMRLLDKSASIRRLSELGFLPDTLDRYAKCYKQPYGVILVTGPTGAGKTTTLYATLKEVMSPEKSVVTVEDPVEYKIEGITQLQVNQKAGMQFSTALRSILRADPDIILVGEIRDIETATVAMEAALSGHLVLSTLHTNTAASTPLRLTEMGIEPFLVTSAVVGVMTQRLARVLCERCKEPFDASFSDFYAAGFAEGDLEGLDTNTLYRAKGCRTCSSTGYYGRMLLGEVMPLTEEIERMIIEQRSIVAMERQAVEQGMRTLRQDGLRKAIVGCTTLEEVLRVVV